MNRRQFFDQVVKVGGFAALFSMLPTAKILEMLCSNPERASWDQRVTKAALTLRDMDVAAEAATLPLNYVSRPFLVPSGADMRNGATELTTNTGSGGSGSSSAVDNTDTTFIKNGGTKNVVVTMIAIGGTRNHDMRCSLPSINMTTHPTISFRHYFVEGQNSDQSNHTLDWCNNASGSNGFRFQPRSVPNHAHQRQGWHFFQWHRDEYATLLGAGVWPATFDRLHNTMNGPSGTTRVVYWDQNYYSGYQRPVIPWILEGGIDTHYTVAFAKWTVKGVVGTLAIPTNVLDTGGFLTTAQVDEMYAAGWDVIDMSDTTTAVTGLSVQQVVDRFSTARNMLISKGWTRSLGVTALPGTATTPHRTDANAIIALTQLGYIAAIDKYADGSASTNTNGNGIDPHYGISLNPYRIPAWRTENPNTLSEYQFHIRHAIKAGGARILRSGSLVTGAASGQIETADHDSLLGELALYHHAGTLSLYPWRKFYSGLSGRVTR